MLDSMTKKFLTTLMDANRKWISKSSLRASRINVDILNIEHLEELNYIETMIHLEEQYRITPTGERALIEHERELQREKKETFRYRITTLIAVIALIKSFMPEISAVLAWLLNLLRQ